MKTTARRRRRRAGDQRLQDVDQQRAPFGADRAAVQDRSRRRAQRTRASRWCSSSTGPPGLTVSRDLPKLGYKGVESCELTFDDCRVPASAILGGEPGKGFAQMMKGLETGRIQVASRALGVATAALEDALALRAGARELRPADLEAPGRRPLPGRHGDQADRRPPAHAAMPPTATTRASAPTWRPGWPSCSPPRSRWRSR